MIEKLMCVDDDNFIGTYQCDGKTVKLLKSELRKIWDYDDDGTFIKLHSNGMNQVYGIITVADGQGGVAVVWDGSTGKITHISEAAYAIDVAVTENNIYALLEISNFVTASTVKLIRNNLGEMDPNKEGEEVSVDIPQEVFKNIDARECATLYVDDKEGRVEIEGIGVFPFNLK